MVRLKVDSKHGLLRDRRLALAPRLDGALQRTTKQLADGRALSNLLAATSSGGLVAGTNNLQAAATTNTSAIKASVLCCTVICSQHSSGKNGVFVSKYKRSYTAKSLFQAMLTPFPHKMV